MRFLTNRLWLVIGVVGSGLFFATEQALRITGNHNFFPTVILLGAFVIPSAFVAFFFAQERSMDKGVHSSGFPFNLVLTCFLVGGVLGTTVAGIIEFKTLHSFTVPNLFAVGLIEETAKLIVPLVLFIAWRYQSEGDGLLFGVASGMGFAALETMGYGLATYVNSNGNIGETEQVVLVRGLLSPLGHASWTGLVCATMWRERGKTGRFVTWAMVGTFLLAVFLHAAWDISSTVSRQALIYTSYAVIGSVSLGLLISKLKQARQVAEAAGGKQGHQTT